MRIVLDTCVLYPTVMREMLLGVARAGMFTPIWSPRILEEWARAAIKLGPTGEAQARAEIAALSIDFAAACHPEAPHIAQRLWLPDAQDIHVLALAVNTSADAIMTLNAKDFPRGTLMEQGLKRCDPDGFLMTCWQQDDAAVQQVADRVLKTANTLSGGEWGMRALLKKARLPRLAKALS